MEGIKAVWPFLGVIVGVMVSIMLFPSIATWLPSRVIGGG